LDLALAAELATIQAVLLALAAAVSAVQVAIAVQVLLAVTAVPELTVLHLLAARLHLLVLAVVVLVQLQVARVVRPRLAVTAVTTALMQPVQQQTAVQVVAVQTTVEAQQLARQASFT
jgi:hypothetical protein